MSWETVIGLEVHVQLATKTKIFSGASTAFGAEPNTQACAIDLAMPGTLPVLNKQAVHYAVMFGLAIDAEIGKESAAEGSVDLRADGGMSYALTPPQGRAAEVCLRGMGVWVGGQEEEIAEIAECRGNMANWWRGGRVVRWLREVTVGLNVWKKASHCRTRDLEEEGTRAVAGSWEMRGGK